MKNRKIWIIGLGLFLLLASFILSESFRDTLSRRNAIKKATAESRQINQQIQTLQQDLVRIKNQPQEVEHLVRRDLGYMRPGEKEIRFPKEKK